MYCFTDDIFHIKGDHFFTIWFCAYKIGHPFWARNLLPFPNNLFVSNEKIFFYHIDSRYLGIVCEYNIYLFKYTQNSMIFLIFSTFIIVNCQLQTVELQGVPTNQDERSKRGT